MNPETNLKKVNERLYIQPCKHQDGRDFEIKWEKQVEPMWLDLTDIKLCHTFSIEHPVFSLRFDAAMGKVKEGDKLPYEQYERQEWRVIRATRQLNKYTGWRKGDTIGLITKEGLTNSKVYSEVNVFIRRMDGDLTQADVEDKKANGTIGHLNDTADVYLDFAVPSDVFDNAYRELREVKDKEVTLCVYADVFNSESDRTLRPPDMPKEFFIEDESSFSSVYFHSLVIAEPVSNSPSKEISSGKDEADTSENPSEVLPAIARTFTEVRSVVSQRGAIDRP